VICALVTAIAVAAPLACGPVRSTAFLTDADNQLEAARQAGAEKHAPYEWTAATLYLHKAREEMGRSQYEYAVDFARKASTYAAEARAAAVKAAKGTSDRDSAARP
jgi:hypothetical protein